MRTAVAIVILLVAATLAHADDEQPELQRMRFVERGEDLIVTAVKFGKLFDAEAFQALSSGFPSTVAIGASVYAKDSRVPVHGQILVRSVVYDLWDEVYLIKFEGDARKPIKVKSPAEALKLLTSVDDLPIAKLVDLPFEDVFYLQITIQLNPVSRQTLTEMRRWLSQGTGGGLDRGGVFFGSFVSVFVNPKIAEADRVLRIRSQPFYRPKP
ncbi:MAG: hypothetical protein JWO36_1148 [Myxococcales bacterium]|nr:hypothetical protein [Myxococcales bacterium]